MPQHTPAKRRRLATKKSNLAPPFEKKTVKRSKRSVSSSRTKKSASASSTRITDRRRQVRKRK